jgi:hypothetical protein
VELETTPEQPEAVVRALAAALDEEAREPDPWWRAGSPDGLEE